MVETERMSNGEYNHNVVYGGGRDFSLAFSELEAEAIKIQDTHEIFLNEDLRINNAVSKSIKFVYVPRWEKYLKFFGFK